MLESKNAVANLAVKDLERARKFYEGTLGLKPVHEESGEMIAYKSGDSLVNVYRSDYAGTNQATALTWSVGDELEAIMADLKAKGVAFEHYDLPGMEQQGDLHVSGDMKLVWFKDPDGNILNLLNVDEEQEPG